MIIETLKAGYRAGFETGFAIRTKPQGGKP
jgi:hypothetical protein